MDLKEQKWDFLYVLQTFVIAKLLQQAMTADTAAAITSIAVNMDECSMKLAPREAHVAVAQFYSGYSSGKMPDWYVPRNKPGGAGDPQQ